MLLPPANIGNQTIATYRPEVDGLRAVAVIPVVLFHAGFNRFSGGYVGVDVFFVISGYLITSILIAEMTAKSFTITGFYERRARRILPALFLVMLTCMPFAWFWMTPHHLKGFAQSLVAASVFAPNIYFFLKSNYFDFDADEKPLLHTWSLGVEEQYYIVFPLLLMVFWRLGLTKLVFITGFIALLSLGLSEWASHTHPVANFFLASMRAWELGLGALPAIAIASGYTGVKLAVKLRELLTIIGLCLIVFAVFSYNQSTLYPGIFALAPTIGAVLIIFYANQQTYIGRLLSLKPIVWIGLISYSFYLWHQPLLAFAHIYSIDKPSPYLMGGLIGVSIILAYLTWRFVEQPFRKRNRFSQRQIFSFTLLGSVFFIGCGLAGQFKEGFPERLNAGQQAIMTVADNPKTQKVNFVHGLCFLEPEQNASAFGNCVDNPNNATATMYLWGDSHAAHLYPGISKFALDNYKLTTFTAASCPPLLDVTRPNCKSVNDYVFARIIQEKPDRVMLAAVWGNYGWASIIDTVKQLKNAGIKQIDLVGPVPRWTPSLPIVLIRYGVDISKVPERTTNGLDPTVSKLDSEMRTVAAEQGVNYISPVSILCNAAGCITRVGDQPDSIIQWDVSHLTKSGSEYLVTRFWH